MSAIPPNSIGSILQSDAAQQHQSRIQDTERNAKSAADRAGARGVDDIIEIEAADTDDTRVDADSGGLGGQGRQDGLPEEEVDAAADVPGDDEDDGEMRHLDLQA